MTNTSIYNSKYNYFLKNGKVLNLVSGSLIELEPKQLVALEENDFKHFSSEELEKLAKMGFIVPYKNEDRFYNNLRKKEQRTDSSKLGLTILTTTACNANCQYCYEKNKMKNVILTKTTQNKLLNFIYSKNPKSVNISWFGGEPLLNTDAINCICDDLKSHDINYSCSMISNGFLIGKYIDSFKKWNLKNIQITLDGIKDDYNKVKKFHNDDSFDAFSIVIENIKKLLAINIRVAIRLNFDRNNYKSILETIEFLRKEIENPPNFVVYVAHIFGNPENYHLSDGSNIYYFLYKKLYECGYLKKLNQIGFSSKLLYCFITNPNHFVVSPDGFLYRCEHQIINNDIGLIGDLTNGITNIKNNKFWLSLKYPYSKCYKCKFKYLCLGGCKSEAVCEKHLGCMPIIDCIEDIIDFLFE